ncbi:MAG: vWA domain-containing protein [Planctomycetota bacterium]
MLCLTDLAGADLTSDVRRAMRGDDPVGELRAARSAIADADRKQRNAAAAAIEKSLKKEGDPTVRRAAIDFLLALRTDRSLDRVVAGAVDRYDDVRQHVRFLVRDHADPAFHDAIVRGLEEDSSWRFRAAMVELLLAGARAAAKAPLLKALEDEHPAVAARAAEALERMTGKAYGLDGGKWKEHFDRMRPPGRNPAGETRTVADVHRKVKLHEGPVRGLTPTLYTVPVREKRVIFVVDMSNSMRKGIRSNHFTELKRALFGLPSDVFFNILCFDQRMFFYTKAKSLAAATTDHKYEAARWMDELPAGERTDVNRSVVSGLAMLNEALRKEPAVKAELFILTDGRETATSMSPARVDMEYLKLPEARCWVHVIALGRRGTPALRRLAERSGGRFHEVTDG